MKQYNVISKLKENTITMDRWLLCFILGAILSLFSPIVPAIFYQSLLFGLILLLIYIPKYRTFNAFFLGFIWLLFNAFQLDDIWLENEITSVTFFDNAKTLSLVVKSIPVQKEKTLRFNALVKEVDNKELTTPFSTRLNWNIKTTNFNHNNHVFENLAQGQQVKLLIKLKPTHGFANYGGFNYQRWLNAQHIVATGYVINTAKNQLIQNESTIRQQWYSHFKNTLPTHDLLPFILALTFADKSLFTTEHWEVIQATGTQHLFAISGLHLGLVAIFSFNLFLLFFRLLPFQKLTTFGQIKVMRLNIRAVALIFSTIVTFFYGYLADFSMPTIRAFIMLLLFVSAKMLGIHLSIKRWLLLTVALIIIITPFALISISFWLSLYAVCIIFLTIWRFDNIMASSSKSWRYVKSLLVLQISLVLFLIPISGFYFQQISLIGIVSNLIVLPIASFLIIPFSLITVITSVMSPLLAQPFIFIALELLNITWWLLELLSGFNWSLIKVSSVQSTVLFLTILLIGGLVFTPIRWLNSYQCLRRYVQKNYLVVAVMFGSLAMVGFSFSQNSNVEIAQKSFKDWQVNVLDVGQGLAVTIERNNRVILYDTGASYPSGYNLAEAVVIPYLIYKGLVAIDYVIVSHNDNDHAGGVDKILSYSPQSKVLRNSVISPSLNGKTNSQSTAYNSCKAGESFIWQGLSLKILSPLKDEWKSENDNSCVVLISDGHFSVLLTGDISNRVERELLKEHPEITTDIVIAPHHGSKTSSSLAFINALSAKYTVFSTGFRNRWRMPHPSVVERYINANVQHFNTAKHGMIQFVITSNEIKANKYRQDLWPFWFAN